MEFKFNPITRFYEQWDDGRIIKIIQCDIYKEGTYIFPDASRLVSSAHEQANKIVSEAKEVLEAIDSRDNWEHVVEEAYDTIHACETLLRYLGADQQDMDYAIQHVVTKNYERGYYGLV